MGILTSIADIERKLAIRRTIVLFVTLWMTFKSFEWAAAWISSGGAKGYDAALIITAVTAPITYLQKVVFEEYIKSKGAS